MKKFEKICLIVPEKLSRPIFSYLIMRLFIPVNFVSFLFILLFCITKNCYSEAPDIFELLLPDNIPLQFQAVYLGIDGEKVFDSKRIQLGSRQEDASHSYKVQKVATLLAGSFTAKRNGKADWLYYLGKTEIEQRQWNAVMRWWEKEKGYPIEPINTSNLPQTGSTVAEIYNFIEALNTWMIKQSKDKLPSYRNAKAFCRLPTEAEWEFAARGGINVRPDVFDRPYPYEDENGQQYLGGFEWYRSTSGNKVRECGSSNLKPNPVGLYDMLGNVEELTLSLFGPEYQQGRFGDLVIRGSNFSTDQKDISVSARTEYSAHASSGELLRPAKVGFRLTLSTRIASSGYLNEELDEEYERYAKSKGLTHPGLSGNSSPTTQATEDLIERYKVEQQRLQDINEDLLGKLNSKEEEYKKAKVDLAQKDNSLNYKDMELRHKDQQMEALKNRSTVTDDLKQNQDIIEIKGIEIKQLQNEIARLQGVVSVQQNTIVNVNSMEKELARLKQEVADSKQRHNKSDDEIAKNLRRIRYSEKKLLEAYMRMASYNLFSASENLQKIEAKRKAGLSAKGWENNQKEAKNMIRDYVNHIKEIVTDTQDGLFQEVKAELVVWLKDNKVDEKQIKSLDLVERNVNEMRKGKNLDLEYIYNELLKEPEMQ